MTNKNRTIKKIVLHIRGEFYTTDVFDCKTLKEALRSTGYKRTDVVEWQKEYEYMW